MKKNYLKLALLLSAMSFKGYAMEGSPLDDLSKEQRQAMSQLFAAPQAPVAASPVVVSAGSKKVQPLKKEQGNLDRTDTEHGVTQAFGKARAIEEVTQGNISDSKIGGNVEQRFKGASAGQSVAQGNVSGVKISGGITQTFDDDEDEG